MAKAAAGTDTRRGDHLSRLALERALRMLRRAFLCAEYRETSRYRKRRVGSLVFLESREEDGRRRTTGGQSWGEEARLKEVRSL